MPEDQKHIHPALAGQTPATAKHRTLWNTNAAFPTSHLIDRTPAEELRGAEPELPSSPPIAEAPAPGTVGQVPTQVSTALSPFTQWLLERKPPAIPGADLERPAVLPVIPVSIPTPDAGIGGKDKKKKKKKQKGKKKKKQKQKAVLKGAKSTGLGALDESIVTDTLAEVTARQGYTEEAITMYRKLVSLHPDKAAFYLERIRALKDDQSEE